MSYASLVGLPDTASSRSAWWCVEAELVHEGPLAQMDRKVWTMGDHPTQTDVVLSSDGEAWVEEWAGGFYITRDHLGSSLVSPSCCAACCSAFRALAAFDYRAVAEHLM